MKSRNTFILICALIVGLCFSCEDDGVSGTQTLDAFQRNEMLADWADLIIIPAFESYSETLGILNAEKDAFLLNANENTLSDLRSAYLNAYKAWQHVSIFDIGKAEAVGLRNFTNIYPTNIDEISENINSQNYNLELPSNFDAQGFPALDYLLYGIGNDDAAITDLLTSDDHSNYLNALISRLNSLTTEVLNDWNNGYRETFIDNDGSSATASVDKIVNDFLFYYERFLRAGKVGIPAGIFSNTTLSNSVESPYSDIHSKVLFLEANDAVVNFFKGKSFDKSITGQSLRSYLTHLSTQNQTDNLALEILAQFELVTEKANELSDSFKSQVENDNQQMLATYDEMQKAVILMKVDMMQALNIQVDYVDADGD